MPSGWPPSMSLPESASLRTAAQSLFSAAVASSDTWPAKIRLDVRRRTAITSRELFVRGCMGDYSMAGLSRFERSDPSGQTLISSLVPAFGGSQLNSAESKCGTTSVLKRALRRLGARTVQSLHRHCPKTIPFQGQSCLATSDANSIVACAFHNVCVDPRACFQPRRRRR